MWQTNLKILALAVVVILFYTGVAHVIPQLRSEVPEALALTSDATPEALVEAGQKIYNGAGQCGSCHGLGTRAPNLLTDHAGQGAIGARCGTRKPGMDCKTYLYESMTQPSVFVVPGFDPIMQDIRRQLPEDQIWAVIAYLQSTGGDVTVTAEDIKRTAPAASAGGAPAPAAAFSATTNPKVLLTEKGCIGCHQFEGQGAPVGPPIAGIGRGKTTDYLRRAILTPNADTAKGFEKFAGMMPPMFGSQLSAAQLEALVNFLANQK